MLLAGRLAEVSRTAQKVERARFGTTHEKKKSNLMVKFEVNVWLGAIQSWYYSK